MSAQTNTDSTAEAPAGAPVPKRSRLTADEALVALLGRLLGRRPRPREIEIWEDRLGDARNAAHFVTQLMNWGPISTTKVVESHSPAGHYYSPVVDPDEVRGYVDENRAAVTDYGMAGVPMSLEDMEAFWTRNRAVIASTPFPEHPQESHRYAFRGGPYAYGDGTTLRAIIHDKRPQRIIEVGSGYSTACMLDSIEEFGLDTTITCIEPYPARLKSILRDGDVARVTIIEQGVQGQDLSAFAALDAGDIVFIDSTHIIKTGSDVHYELFYILPVLKPGVIVHFHDCRFPFEYSDKQIFEKNFSWNEVYAVRALLMNSTRFKVIFSGSTFAHHRPELIEETFALYLRNPGSALWLEVMDDGGPFGLDAVGGMKGFEARTEPDPALAGSGLGGTANAPATKAARAAPARPPAPRPAAPAGDGAEVGVTIKEADGKANAHLTVRGTTLTFPLALKEGPVCVSLGVRKSGSTMLHNIVTRLAKAADVNHVNVPGTFFRAGFDASDWARLDLAPLLQGGNILTGFRNYPARMAASPAFVDGLKIFMHRDPRDAIVSQYFSDAFSHALPEVTDGDDSARNRFLEKRRAAQESAIDGWVLDHAPHLAKTLADFAPMLSDPRCLVLPYETYVFDKATMIAKILHHFGWHVAPDVITAVLAEIDVVPSAEDPKRFVRKATPGDHREKLTQQTQDRLNEICAEAMALFGYER